MAKRGKAPSANTETIVVKVTPDLKESIEAATAKLVPGGLEASVSDVARMLLVRALETLEYQERPSFPIEGR